MGTQGAARYRFGLYEADEATGELRRQGLRIRLQSQPFQVLLLLLSRPGQVLSREEISRELWPDGTFVDFDHGVNSAVNRIREALGDRASNPRFVETLARRGYRFVAPVERLGSAVIGPQPTRTAPPLVPQETQIPSVNPHEVGSLLPLPASSSGEPRRFRLALATPADLPRSSPVLVQILFVALQVMYLVFYVCTLAHLREIFDLISNWTDLPTPVFGAVVVTSALLIPARIFLFCAALFRPPAFPLRFARLWPFLLVADLLWSLAPFLLLHHISFGLALAAVAVLVYSPFAQRSLVLMGAGQDAVKPQQ